MSEKQNRDFSKYDSMTTEELEEILRLDVNSPEEGESDVELLLYVMEVLASRRNTEHTGKTALEAWEAFQREYLYEEEDCTRYKPEIRKEPWLRRMIAAAAVIALLVCIPVTANAFGWEDIWEVFARWAKETFSFVHGEEADVREPVTRDDLEYTSLQDMLKRNNRPYDMVPTWIPDGYTLERIEKDVSPIQEVYSAFYKQGDCALSLRVTSYLDSDPEKIEINEDILEVYENEGIQYYIFSNIDQIRAVWIKDVCECNISGTLTIDELKLMIDSIGKG